MIIYTALDAIRLDYHESTDSEVLFQISNEEYASIKFELNSWIPFDAGDYVVIWGNRYTLMDKPAPIAVNGTNRYSYTLKFESPRAFLDRVNFELFDDTSLLVINKYDAKTIYVKGSVVQSDTNVVWRFIYDTPKAGIALVEGVYWTSVPAWTAGNYVIGNYVYIANVVYLCLKATSVAPVEGSDWTVVNTAPAFDFTSILTPRGYAELLVSNMNRARPNQTWVVGDCLAANPLTQAFSNVTCLGALTSICNLFQTEHWIDMDGTNFRININKLAYTTTPTIQLEQGNGLTSITKQEVSGSKRITRLVALGSTNNLYGTYRNGSNRLMLPNRYYIDSDNNNPLNPLEGIQTWDDIMPELHHATQDYNPLTAYNIGDQVLDIDGKSFDCWVATTAGTPTTDTTHWKLSEGTITTFVSQYKFIDSNLTFNPLDPKYIMSDGTQPKVSFLTGNMAGYQFPITAFDTTTKQITISQIQDSTNSYLPSAVYGMSQFDQYVLLDLYMPQSYVDKAELRLLDKATEYLAQFSLDQNQYDCPLDEVWATNNSVGFRIGQIVHIYNANLNINADYRIINIKRNITSQYKQNITLSQLPYVQSSYQALKNDVVNNTTYLEQSGVTSAGFKQRTLRGAQEALDMAFNPDGDFYTNTIQPLTVQTASVLVGTATQQFTLSGLKFSSAPNTPNYIAWTAGSITDTKMQTLPRTWSVVGSNFVAPSDTIAYYCYLKCPVNTALTSGDITFSQTQYKTVGTDGYYYFLVGTLGAVVDNMRQFYTSYGFTFINGNTITTGKIQGNGASFDLDTGEIQGTITFKSGVNAETAISDAQQAAIDAQQAAIDAAAADATTKANAAQQAAINEATNMAGTITTSVAEVQRQLDGVIIAWYSTVDPTMSNYPVVDSVTPANSWSTDVIKNQHANDTYTNTSTGGCWRFVWDVTNGWYWAVIADTATQKALLAANNAQTTADGKRQVFVAQPTTAQSYAIGDLWTGATVGSWKNELLKCVTAKAAGQAFDVAHWALATKYTDDTAVNNLVIGGRNLLLNSALERSSDSEYVGVLITDIVVTNLGKQVMFSFEIKSEVAGNIRFYSLGGYKINTGITTSCTTSWKKVTVPVGLFSFSAGDTNGDVCSLSWYGTYGTGIKPHIRNIKIELGNKATDWTPAPEDVAADILTAQTAADDANITLGIVTSDAWLSTAEKPAELSRWNDIINEIGGLDTQATSFGITTEKTAYDTAFTNLANYLNAGVAWSSGTPAWLASLTTDTSIDGATYRSKWNAYYSAKIALLNKMAAVAKGAGDNAQTAANAAASAASAAQSTANTGVTNAATANALLSDIANDNKFTASEKQQAKNEWDAIVSEKVKNDSQADTFGVSKTAYGTAYNSLSTYITSLLSDLTITSDIVGTTFRSTFKSYYDARTDLLNAIAAKAKSLADAAQTTANNIQVGGRNLIVNSKRVETGNTDNYGGYNLNPWHALSKPLEVGKLYTISWKQISGVAPIRVTLRDTGYHNVQPVDITNGTTFVCNVNTVVMLYFYCDSPNQPFSFSEFKLELGNKATDWTPAPEDVDANIATAQAAANAAASAASAAQSTANTGVTNAATANALLSDIANDNKFTASEKQQAKNEWDAIVSEKVKNDSQADTFGVSKTAYSTAYNSLSTYITSLLSDLTVTSDIVGTTFRSTFKSYYDARTDLLNAIAAKAKTLADNAQTNFDNLQKGDNLITNSNFRNGLTGWYLNYNPSVGDTAPITEIVYTNLPSGALSGIKITTNNTTWQGIFRPITFNGDYILSFYVKADLACNLSYGVESVTNPLIAIGTSWQKVTIKFTATSSHAILFYIDATTSFYLTNVMLGGKDDDWKPASGDMDASYGYLKTAMTGTTDINGGLLSTVLLRVKDASGAINGGMSGIASDNVGFWTGGTYQNAIDSLAKVLFRKDGSGQLAGGKIFWDLLGALSVGNFQIINGNIIGKNSAGAENIRISTESIPDLSVFTNNYVYSAQGISSSGAFSALVRQDRFTLEYITTVDSGSTTSSVSVQVSIPYATILVVDASTPVITNSRSDIIYASLVQSVTIKNAGGTVVASGSVGFGISIPSAGVFTVIIDSEVLIGNYNVEGNSYLTFSVVNGISYQESVQKTAIGLNGLYSYFSSSEFLYFKSGVGLQYRGAIDIPAGMGGFTVSSVGAVGGFWGNITSAGTGTWQIEKSGNNYIIHHNLNDGYLSASVIPISTNVAYKSGQTANSITITCAGGFDCTLIRTK